MRNGSKEHTEGLKTKMRSLLGNSSPCLTIQNPPDIREAKPPHYSLQRGEDPALKIFQLASGADNPEAESEKPHADLSLGFPDISEWQDINSYKCT